MPNRAQQAAKWLIAALLLPLVSAVSCDSYPYNAQANGLVTASSTWATDGTLTVNGTLDISLSSWDSDTSFALDGLRFYFTSTPDVALEIESLELNEEEWPVFVEAGSQETRTVRFTLRAPPTDPLPQGCPSSLSIDVAIDVLADGAVDAYPVTFASVHVCEGCATDPDAVDIPVAWEFQNPNLFAVVTDIEVDAAQSVWLLGPSFDNTGFLVQVVTPGGFGLGIHEPNMFGQAEIASGSQPGIILATSSEIGFGGMGGGGPAGPTPSVRISRYDTQGLAAWQRDVTGNFPKPTLAAFSGLVLVGVSSPDGLATDGEILDPAPNDYLVLLDEETGEVVSFSAGFAATAMAPTGDGAVVVFGYPSDAIDLPELRLLDAALAPIWSTEVSDNGITLFAELAAAGDEFLIYDPAAGLVMKRSADGSPEWDTTVPTGATKLAALPDGGALLGGTGIAVRLSAQGVVTDLTGSDDSEPLWCAGPLADYGFATAGESPGFVFTDPTWANWRVGRLAP